MAGYGQIRNRRRIEMDTLYRIVMFLQAPIIFANTWIIFGREGSQYHWVNWLSIILACIALTIYITLHGPSERVDTYG